VHNLIAIHAPNNDIHNYNAENICLYLVFDTSDIFLQKNPHMLWYGNFWDQCLLFRQRRVLGGKIPAISMAG
jgi:hypothetical protein